MSVTAAPPPRDAGPERFVAPPPRAPLYPEPAPTPGQPATQAQAESRTETKPAANTPEPNANGADSQPAPANAKPAGPPAARTQTAPKPRAPAATKPATKTTKPTRASASRGQQTNQAPRKPVSSGIESGVGDTSRLSAAPESSTVRDFDPFPEKRGLAARHYPASNENRIDLFRPYLENLGGGYVGVGTDQNLTFIAWARSRYAWLMDFDPVSVNINRIHLYFLKRARTYGDFHRLWSRTQRARSAALLKAHFKGQPEQAGVLRAFSVAHGKWAPVPNRLRSLNSFTKRFGLSSFHNNPDDYAYLRNMALAGRIQALPGDLRGDTSLKAINAAALEVGVPVRIIYTSNAEDYFKVFPAGFRANMIDVPGDARSVVVRTVSRRNYIYGQPPGEKFPKRAPFHYNVQTLDSLKAWFQLPRPLSITSIMDTRRPVQKGFSVVDTAPSRKPAGKVQTPAAR